MRVQISGRSRSGSKGCLEEGGGRGSGYLSLLFNTIQLIALLPFLDPAVDTLSQLLTLHPLSLLFFFSLFTFGFLQVLETPPQQIAG